MASSSNKLEKLYGKYLNKMSGFLSNDEARNILSNLSNGSNQYMRIDRVESSSYDDTWIKKIEDVIFDLGDIIANPRQNTKTVSDLVPVELAKKVNSESIRHLASHTQFIKEVTEGGDVIPSKILNIGHDDDILTYENRFIATFVRKLLLFVEKRYEYIMKFATLRDEEVLMYKNKSNIDDSEIEIETTVRVKTKKEDETDLNGSSYLQRIEQMREYILYFYSSSFMKKFKNERDVRNPILQTNIIRKNLKYHHCYEVYKFLDKYSNLGVNFKINETFSQFNDAELAEINYAGMVNFLTLKARHMSETHKTNTKTYKPRIITSIDDEAFMYGPIHEGPIEFVRVDDSYKQYLESKVRKDLPVYPTKREKEYYQEEYETKKEVKSDIEQLDKFNKRKAKEADKFDKLFEAFVKERREEEERVRIMILDAVKQLDEYRLADERERLAKQAKEDMLALEKAKKALEKELEKVRLSAKKEELKEEINVSNDPLADKKVAQTKVNKEETNKVAKSEKAITKKPLVTDNKDSKKDVLTNDVNAKEVKPEIAKVVTKEESNKETNKVNKEAVLDKANETKPKVSKASNVKSNETKKSTKIEEVVSNIEEIAIEEAEEKIETVSEFEAHKANETSLNNEENIDHYILLTPKGYYVGVNKYTSKRDDARVYTNLPKLIRIQKRSHGDIIKL